MKIVKCVFCSNKIYPYKSTKINVNGKEEIIYHPYNISNSILINGRYVCEKCFTELFMNRFGNPKILNVKINELADIFVAENGLDLRLSQSMIDDFVLSHSDIANSQEHAYPLYGRINKRIRDYYNKAKVIEVKKNDIRG